MDTVYQYHHYGVYAQTGSTINIGAGSSIRTETGIPATVGSTNGNPIVRADGSYGSGASIIYSSINIGDGAQISSDNHQSYGLWATGGESATKGVKITLGSNSTITLGGANAWGAFADAGAKIELGDNVTIKTTSTELWTSSYTSSYGLYTRAANSSITAGDDLTIETKGSNSCGFMISTGSKITAKDRLTVTTEGASAYGIYASGAGSTAIVGEEATITTSGTSAYAVLANTAGQVTLDEGAIITTTGDKGYGLYALAANSKITVGDNVTVSALGDYPPPYWEATPGSIAKIGIPIMVI